MSHWNQKPEIVDGGLTLDRPVCPTCGAPGTACEGCGRGLTPAEVGRWPVCLDCTRARHRAVVARGRCRCGKSKQRPGEEVRQGGRAWIPCRRCLGAITEVTP